MKIISQDGTKTIDLSIGHIICEGNYIFYSFDGENNEVVGYYSNASKAQEVKNRIDSLLETTVFRLPKDEDKKEMIDEMSDAEIIRIANQRP